MKTNLSTKTGDMSGPTTVPGDPISCANSSAAASPSSGLYTSSATPTPSVGSASPSSCASPRHSASPETGATASPTSRPRYSVAFRCPTRGLDRFRPFSCKSYLPLGGALRRLCPSCAQKIPPLPREYLSENLLGVGRTLTQKWPKQAQKPSLPDRYDAVLAQKANKHHPNLQCKANHPARKRSEFQITSLTCVPLV